MKASQRIRIEGRVSAGFEAVRDVFAENFFRRYEPGGACCVHYQWDKVVQLMGSASQLIWPPKTRINLVTDCFLQVVQIGNRVYQP